MGAGDVKLAIGVGALTGCCGAGVWFLAAFGAPLLTVLVGMVARIRGGARGGRTVPHGPSMCLASAAGIGLSLL
ncbi:prepilin peptidase, partial [Mycobacterium tuberculosis]|nr:prepilin peptidase [Mycobacterium tuberculosis]